ncbi:hypothetical protein BSLG_000147 [Batrachochytrium salamandrivorans]|nr:hypothetical protein BSLG_000147 [Batrachochytrium salamandrivorans]
MKPISFVAISFLAITVSAWSPWDSPYQNLPTSPSTTTQSEQPPQSTATQSPQHSGQDKVEAELARLTAVYQKEKDIVAPIEAKYNINKQNAIDVGGRMKSIAAKLEETDIDDDEKLELEKKYREAKAECVVLVAEHNKYYRIKVDKDRSEDNLKTLRAEYKDGIQRREKQYEIVKDLTGAKA